MSARKDPLRHPLDILSPSLAALALWIGACADAGTSSSTMQPGGTPSSGGAPSTGGSAPSGAGGANVGGASASGTGTGGSLGAAGAAGASGGGGAGTPGSGGTAGSGQGGSALAGAGASAGTRAGTSGSGAIGGATASAAGTSAGAGSSGAAGGGAGTAELVGFATLNAGTTGGKGGAVVTASTYAELKSYAESSTAYIIMVEGTISNGADGGKVSVKSNKSIIGVGSTAFLYGVGLEVNGANNIILQNFRISMTGVTTRTDKAGVYSSTGDEGSPQILVNGGDAISISGTSKNIWIDHCELFSEDPAVQTNHDLYDGLIDVKNQTGFITVSWCYLHDHHKAGLVGSSDTDLYDDRKITFHHNYYKNVKLRIPMYRGAVGHFFDNYIVGAEDATEIRAGTCVRVEKNYYEALHYSIYTPTDAPGSTERIDNVEVSRSSRAYPANCTADIPYSYASVLDDTEDVKTVVPAGAGVGKL